MKNLMLRLLSIAVCLCMLVSLVPTAFAVAAESEAENKNEENVSAVLQLTDGAPEGTPINIKGQTRWNPLLGFSPEDTDGWQNRVVAATPGKGYIFYDSTPMSDVLTYVRNRMKARETTFAITYQSTKTYNYKTFSDLIFFGALEHTGVGNEGDYLRWSLMNERCGITGYERQYITYTYQITYLTTAAQERQMDTAVNNLLSSLQLGGCTDYQKVRKIYDWMCDNITYDYAGFNKGIVQSPLTWTAYKGLTQGTCVCQGYGTLFYRLALECGIDARLISGNPQAPHGWNIVKLGSYYYNLDATWDAELHQAGQDYRFFLRSPANFVDHYRDPEYNTTDFQEAYPMSSTDYVQGKPIAGDMNGDEGLNTDDAVYLLLNIMFGSGDYAVASSARRDTNGDGWVTTDDAVHLLLHVMFGAVDYPLAA